MVRFFVPTLWTLKLVVASATCSPRNCARPQARTRHSIKSFGPSLRYQDTLDFQATRCRRIPDKDSIIR